MRPLNLRIRARLRRRRQETDRDLARMLGVTKQDVVDAKDQDHWINCVGEGWTPRCREPGYILRLGKPADLRERLRLVEASIASDELLAKSIRRALRNPPKK
jgi:hypothetical protein